MLLYFFFFNDTATTEIYTLSLHDALPISSSWSSTFSGRGGAWRAAALVRIEFGGHDGFAEIARHGAFAAQRGLQAVDIGQDLGHGRVQRGGDGLGQGGVRGQGARPHGGVEHRGLVGARGLAGLYRPPVRAL